jgi:hypothetical protein
VTLLERFRRSVGLPDGFRSSDDLVREDIRRAREILVEEGWCQGHLRDSSGRHCLVGALMDATLAHSTRRFHRARDRVAFEVGSPVDWNDCPGRTKEQVLELLETLA